MNRQKYITVFEIAQELELCTATVYRWIKSGKLPAYKLSKVYLIEKKDFEKLLTKVGKK